MQPIYFAHGYREREAPFAAYFGKLLRQQGFIPSLDPPSDTVNAAKLERHLNFTKGLTAVLANRDGTVSPHILYEISMCVRSGQPLLVFLEDTLPGDILPRRVPQRRFSSRSYVRETREHMHAFEMLETYIGREHIPRYEPLSARRSCLLIGTKSLGSDYAEALGALLEQSGYDTISVPDGPVELPIASHESAEVRGASLAIAVLDDNSPSSMYFLGNARSCLVPTILLSTNKKYPLNSSIPHEYQRILIDRNCLDSGIQLIGQQIELFEEDFIELDQAGEAEKYAQELAKSSSPTGDYSKDIRSTIIKEVTMGDKYSAHQVGAQGPGAHAHDMSFNQIWNQRENTLDIGKLANDLSKLRVHLKSIAETPEDDSAVGAVAEAEVAAKSGDGPGALEALSKAGKWAFANATKIGVAVATAAFKSALGL